MKYEDSSTKNIISNKGTKDIDNAIGAFIEKYFYVIYIQNSLSYNQYLDESLKIEIGNFHIFFW